MKREKNLMHYLAAGVVSISATGLSSGCDSADLDAVITGVEIVAQAIAELDSDDDDDISFGDWLLDELED